MKSQSQMIFLLFIGYVVVYIDKTVMGFALLPIEKEFGLTSALGMSVGLLLVFRFLSGVGHSGYPCSCAKAVVSNFTLEKRTFAQSVLLSSAGLAMTVGPIVAVSALEHLGWHTSFVALGIVACAIALLIALRVPYQKPAPRQAAHGQREALWRNPTVLLLFFSVFCINIPSYGLLAWLPKFFVQSMGMPIEVSGYIVAAGGAGIWLSSLCTGWLVGKYFHHREPQVILICALVSAAAILGIFHTTTAVSASILLFVGEIFLMATFVTAFTLPMKRLPENIMGSAIGLINTGGTLGGFVSPVVIGYLVGKSHSYESAFIFLSLAMVCAGVAIVPLIKKPAPSLPVTD